MAQKIKSYEFKGRGRGSAVYPWDEWTDGGTWEAKAGEDFTCSTKAMRSVLASRAKSQGKKVRTNIVGESIFFQFYAPEAAPEAA